MGNIWLDRWNDGQIGFHEADGSKPLRRFWPRLPSGTRVLVPLCGKSRDLLWLAAQGMTVVGVELSELAVRAFFEENDLEFEVSQAGKLARFEATAERITLYCGDYFDFDGAPCHALFDRGALVAVDPDIRDRYVAHTRGLLVDDPFVLLIALAYDQQKAGGPPFSVDEAAVNAAWPGLRCADLHNDIENGPPKFRKAGLTEVIEAVWLST